MDFRGYSFPIPTPEDPNPSEGFRSDPASAPFTVGTIRGAAWGRSLPNFTCQIAVVLVIIQHD